MTTLLAAILALVPSPSPWRSPLVPVWPPRDYARFAGRLGPAGAGVFARGDRLTFLARGRDNPFRLPFWLGVPFVRDAAGLWVGQARGPGAGRAFFTYALQAGGRRRGAAFYGPRALRPPKAAAPLRGGLETVPLPSRNLGEARKITVYLPPRPVQGVRAAPNAVYMADGQSCEAFARVLEPLILSGRVAPTAIVGIHHGAYQGDPAHFDFHKDIWAREYLKVIDAARFAAHLRFVAEEVVPWAERRYGLAPGDVRGAAAGRFESFVVPTERGGRAARGPREGPLPAVRLRPRRGHVAAGVRGRPAPRVPGTSRALTEGPRFAAGLRSACSGPFVLGYRLHPLRAIVS